MKKLIFILASYIVFADSVNYFWKICKNKIPSEAFEAFVNSKGQSVYVAQVLDSQDNSLWVGELVQGQQEVFAMYNKPIPIGARVKVLCVKNQTQLVWKSVKRSDFCIDDLTAVLGGYFDGDVYVGRFKKNEEYQLANIVDTVALSSDGISAEFDILLEIC